MSDVPDFKIGDWVRVVRCDKRTVLVGVIAPITELNALRSDVYRIGAGAYWHSACNLVPVDVASEVGVGVDPSVRLAVKLDAMATELCEIDERLDAMVSDLRDVRILDCETAIAIAQHCVCGAIERLREAALDEAMGRAPD